MMSTSRHSKGTPIRRATHFTFRQFPERLSPYTIIGMDLAPSGGRGEM